MSDLLTLLRREHSCPDCAGTYRESPWAELRSLIWYRGDLYDEWRVAA